MLLLRPEWKVVDAADERGSLEIYLPPPNMLVNVARGHLSQFLARRWVDVIDVEFKKNRVFHSFQDWEAMTSYDSAARRVPDDVAPGEPEVRRFLEFLVGSRIVAMGISTANVMTALAGLHMIAHTNRADFEAAYKRASRS